jgi:hypothetical protein
MRMQRCSIAAVCGYSAWSMKLRWRFASTIRLASGHAVLRQLVVGGGLEQEPVAVPGGAGVELVAERLVLGVHAGSGSMEQEPGSSRLQGS